MATYFKLVLADMTIPVAKAKQPSLMMQIGYSEMVARLEKQLSRVTDLIPNTFTTAVVVVTPFDVKPPVSPDDALVLIEPFPERSHLSKAGRQQAVNNNQQLGACDFGPPEVTAVVFLNRCVTGAGRAEQVTHAIIHELAHAKSDLNEEMHDQNPKGILAKGGATPGRLFLDSDVKWLSKHLGNKREFRMSHFG